MPDTQALEALLAEVERATGADAILDRGLYELATGKAVQSWTITGGPHAGRSFQAGIIPAYTSDLDAIVALIGRDLPDHEWLRKSAKTMTVYRTLSAEQDQQKQWAVHRTAGGATPALALCAAFLRAKLAIERQP